MSLHEISADDFDKIINQTKRKNRIKRSKKAPGKISGGPFVSSIIYYPDSYCQDLHKQSKNAYFEGLKMIRTFSDEIEAFKLNTQTAPKHPELQRLNFTPPKLTTNPVPKQRRSKGREGKEKIIKVKRFNNNIKTELQKDYKLSSFLKIRLEKPPESSQLYKCVVGYIPGEVEGKIYHKILTCGKENCKTCGADYSIIHNRRITRAFKKVLQLETVGYLVVTVPAQLRNAFLSKDVLQDFRNFVRRKLKRDYNTRGMIRYHWCGDDLITWKPHLNILLEGKWWDTGKLEGFRKAVAKWFEGYFNLTTPVIGNVYYQYVNPLKFAPGKERDEAINKIKHWIKYVLRSTAKRVKDYRVLDTIKGYQNTGYFGTFEKTEKEGGEASAILSGCDPETGEKIKWGAMVKPCIFNGEYRKYAREIIHCKNKLKILYDRYGQTFETVYKPYKYILKKPELIPYGLYVTKLIDMIPAGCQLDVFEDSARFV